MQGLDEVQAYVLLRRWLARNPGEEVSGALQPAQRAALAAEYALERACLLKCLEGLLLHHYATAPSDGGAGMPSRGMPDIASSVAIRHKTAADAVGYICTLLPKPSSLLGSI